jgi:(S)-mandelate dehydrogenase
LIERAEQAGCDKLVVTTDVPVLGAREWDQRNYRAPMQLSLLSVLDVLRIRGWLWQVMIPNGAPEFANLTELLPPGARRRCRACASWARRSTRRFSWADIERIRRRWPGKLILKGILCVEDSSAASTCGADGIVLSNHGGRQLDQRCHRHRVRGAGDRGVRRPADACWSTADSAAAPTSSRPSRSARTG